MTRSIMPRTRFAPSPNGLLHLGHAYAALMAHDLAAPDGAFLLRIEDIDAAQPPELVEAILADLAWLGLEFGAGPVVRQSTRLASYAVAAEG
jgi:glutamyl-Q tRNA(Asp) synthetase